MKHREVLTKENVNTGRGGRGRGAVVSDVTTNCVDHYEFKIRRGSATVKTESNNETIQLDKICLPYQHTVFIDLF